MKNIIIIFSVILPNLLFADILEKFPLACICDKNINALKYFDCKQKVSGTQLNIINNQKKLSQTQSLKKSLIFYTFWD